MQGTVLGAMGNTKSEHRRSLPARSSQSRKGGETQYTISCNDTGQCGRCQKQDTSAVGHRVPQGCFWPEAQARAQREGRRLRGKPFGRKGISSREKEVHTEAGAHRKLRKHVWAAVSFWGRAIQSGQSHVATRTARILRSGRAELGALAKRH